MSHDRADLSIDSITQNLGYFSVVAACKLMTIFSNRFPRTLLLRAFNAVNLFPLHVSYEYRISMIGTNDGVNVGALV